MSKSIFRQALTVLQVLFARLRFVAVFVIAALIVGYWDNIKNHVDKWTRPEIAPDSLMSASASSVEFYCPMHPDVIREEFGQCPKCGMPLVKRKKGEAAALPADVLARVQLTPQRVALANIGTTPVQLLSLHREIRALGVLDYDETKLARISSRIAGRADELFVTFTGQAVKRGDPLYSLYSPEVYTALREYLLNRKHVNELPKDVNADTKLDASAVYSASLDKLTLWGISTEQLDKISADYDRTGAIPTHLTVDSPISGTVVDKSINQGQYVQMGQTSYAIADMTDLWLQIKLYESDMPLVNVGDRVDVTVDAFPNSTFNAAISFKAFQLDPDTRTLDARVIVPNPGLNLRPGMFATAMVRVPIASPQAGKASTTSRAATSMPSTRPALAAGRTLAIPRSAVINTGDNNIVYVQSSTGTYNMRAVKLGPLAQIDEPSSDAIPQEYYPVVAGLNQGDQVVTAGAFLIDAENRLNPSRAAHP